MIKIIVIDALANLRLNGIDTVCMYTERAYILPRRVHPRVSTQKPFSPLLSLLSSFSPLLFACIYICIIHMCVHTRAYGEARMQLIDAPAA